jgi:hypothetical protein
LPQLLLWSSGSFGSRASLIERTPHALPCCSHTWAACLLAAISTIGEPDPKLAAAVARIRVQLRQHEASEDAIFTIGPYKFRPSSKLLLSPKGNKVRLTEKEASILRYLYRAGRRPVSRETLLRDVWGYNSGLTLPRGACIKSQSVGRASIETLEGWTPYSTAYQAALNQFDE